MAKSYTHLTADGKLRVLPFPPNHGFAWVKHASGLKYSFQKARRKARRERHTTSNVHNIPNDNQTPSFFKMNIYGFPIL
jgi:hypothetical protein